MAVYDKKIPMRVCLDDTEVLTTTIENAQTINGHTVSKTFFEVNFLLFP